MFNHEAHIFLKFKIKQSMAYVEIGFILKKYSEKLIFAEIFY